MIKKFGVFVNKFKMPLLVTLLLAVSCLLSAFIFSNRKNVQSSIVEASSFDELTGKINYENTLTINVDDDFKSNKRISAVGKINSKSNRNWTGAPESVLGGTTFSLKWESGIPKIVMTGSSTGTFYTTDADFGYKVIGYVFGDGSQYLYGAYYKENTWWKSSNNVNDLTNYNKITPNINATTDIFDFTTEDIVPNYTESSQIYIYTIEEPVDYTLKLWYGDGKSMDVAPVNLETQQDFSSVKPDSAPEGKTFGYWSFTYPNNVSYNSSTKIATLDITNTAYLEFYCKDYITVGDTTYYNVTKVKGYAISSFNNSFSDAVVKAVWSNPYELEFNNLGAEQNGKTNANGDDLAGVYSKNGSASETGGKLASVTIQSGVSYYPLFNSFGKAFNTKNNFSSTGKATQSGTGANGGYYYLYNYGYEISSYNIKLVITNGTIINSKYLAFNGNWSLEDNDATVVEVAPDTTISTNGLAAYLDSYFQASTSSLKIIATPNWSPASITINVKDSDISVNTSCDPDDPTTSYTVPTHTILSNGQTLAAFYTEKANSNTNLNDVSTLLGYGNKNIILASGQFDYVNLLTGQYSYSDGIYTLSVMPLFMDNVYKVNLNDVFDYPTQTQLQLLNSGSDYSLVQATNGMANIKTCLDSEVMISNTLSKTEEYAKTTFKNCLEQYKKQITLTETLTNEENHSIRDLLRKVYYANATLSGTTLTLRNNTSLFIYLVNGDSTGNLPVFKKPNHELIFWYNENSNRMFKTNLYDNSAEYGDIAYEPATSWQYVTDDVNDQYLKAYYFQKYYFLNLQTLVDYDSYTIGRYGYVKVEIGTDKYIVIYDKVNETIKIYSGDNYEATSGEEKEVIKFYAGDDVKITAYDQTQISSSVLALDKNLEMIGYKLSKIHSNNIDDVDHTSYVYTYTHSVIEEINNRTSYTYNVDVYFAPIQYNISISLSKDKTGNFDVYNNGLTNVNKNSFTISNLNVYDGNNGEKNYLITYNSMAGFKLCGNAFVLSKSNETLQHYDDNDPEQTYWFLFNSQWLRDHFYSISSVSYSRDFEDVDIGVININTEAIQFDYKIKLYDPTSSSTSAFFAEDSVGAFAIDELTGKNTLPSIESKFDTLGETAGYAYLYDSTEYALLNSRLYFPSEPSTIRYNRYTTYNFLMTSKPTTEYEIDSSLLSRMTVSSVGTILPLENRTIYIMLEVREIYKISLKAEMMLHDNNATTRTTTISNGNENVATLTNSAASTFLETAVAYTYKGLLNTISSTFNANHYSDVEYLIEGANLTVNPFTVNEDVSIVVHYIPKALTVAVRYFLNDTEVDIEDISSIISDVAQTDGELYKGNLVTYSSVLTSPDYYYEVYFNAQNAEVNTTSSVVAGGTKYVSKYTVLLTDFDKGFITIDVKLTEKANGSVHVEFVLYDSSQATAYDTQSNFGSVVFYVNSAYTSSTNGTVTVVEGKRVTCHLTIFDGYSMYGWKQKGERNITLTSNTTLEISSSFDPDVDSGIYYIYLTKDIVKATIANNDFYTIASEGESPFISTDNVILSNLYVGKTIDFIFNTPTDNSKDLKYFYYTDISSVDNPILSSGQASLTLTITSQILRKMNKVGNVWLIPCGCELIENHKLTYSIVSGAENVDKFEVKYKPVVSKIILANGNITYTYGEFIPYVSGSYVVDTEIQVEILPNTDPSGIGFYSIATTGSLITISKTEKVRTLDETFELGADETLQVSIVPTEYNAEFTDYVYTNLEDLSNDSPTLESTVSGVESVDTLLYNKNATIYIKTVIMNGDVKDRELKSLLITNPDGTNVPIDMENVIPGAQFGEDRYIYIVSLEDDILAVKFLVDADVSVRLDYVMYKLIHGAEG